MSVDLGERALGLSWGSVRKETVGDLSSPQ